MEFESERVLVDEFVGLLAASSSPWIDVRLSCEFNYARGRADVLALEGDTHVIAFEAKLRDWRTALHQAYRNTCFASQSFVLLPKKAALIAGNNRAEFESRGVGLCYLDGVEIVVLFDAPNTTPIEPWLATEAILQFQQ